MKLPNHAGGSVKNQVSNHLGFWLGWLAVMILGIAGWLFHGTSTPARVDASPSSQQKGVSKSKPANSVFQTTVEEPSESRPKPMHASQENGLVSPPPIPPLSSAIGIVNGQPHPPTMTTTGLPTPEELASMQLPPEVIAARGQPPPPGVSMSSENPPQTTLPPLNSPPASAPLPGIPLPSPASK